ncbi:MAG: Gfo/Idh/MocA family oxidoreductase [Phycisphaeraceae bacterium]|nr:Gfo/Idh/MocA family oxidoreductase [Phycisphaeraceae bacterium]
MNPHEAPHLRVAVIGGGMFFEDVIGQSLKDFMRGGIAPGLSSIGMSHLAPAVAQVRIELVAIGTHSPATGTADKLLEWFRQDIPDLSAKAMYGETVWRDILSQLKPDVLIVATPDHLHTEPILDALDAGCDVVTEKPLCLTTAEVDRIVAAGRRRQRVVAVDLHKRYDPFVRDMMSRARQKYGSINRVRAVLEEPLEVSTSTFAWAEKSNPFAYVGCHWLDVVHHYLHVRPVAVFATGQKNLLAHWDEHHVEIARRKGIDPATFKRRHAIHTWDSLDVAVTYHDGMRGDYNNNWINPAEFEGAVNQEIEVYGIYGRGFVDQQDRGYRETVTGDGTRTRNPTFGGRIHHPGGHLEIFGYGKASLVAGLLAAIRRRILGETVESLEETYPSAASQRDVVRVIEAAGLVAQHNMEAFLAGKGTPCSALLPEHGGVELITPADR